MPWADIGRIMAERYAEDPKVLLTYDGERFNHDGAMLIAETLLRAMGLESVVTANLRKIWRERKSYIKSDR